MVNTLRFMLAGLMMWSPTAAFAQARNNGWPGEEMPLKLPVRTPEDIAYKGEAERQYLIFNLLASGKLAFDAGDHATAVKKWEALLRLPQLAPGIVEVVTPLLAIARREPGRTAATPSAPTPAPAAAAPSRAPEPERRPPPPARVNVTGVVSGGGAIGPGGAVLWLKRKDRPTPPVRPAATKVISQRDKRFIPHVLAVPVGTRVEFRNNDDYYHNVFALGEAARFDTGLYPAGESQGQVFTKAGPVEILCNIHATMSAYVYVVDSPWYTQPALSGAFTIRDVPPGQYELFAWHEAATAPVRQALTVSEQGAQGVTVKIAHDRRPTASVPDKYGRPRQLQLGY